MSFLKQIISKYFSNKNSTKHHSPQPSHNRNTIEACFQLHRHGFALDVNFSIPAQGVTALFGTSGSGKTTVLRCIAGLEKPNYGDLIVAGNSWQTDEFIIPTHKRPLGYVFQESNLFKHLTIEQNLVFGLKRVDLSLQRIPFKEAINLLGLQSLLHRYPSELSGGQRQRAAIARALLTSPQLLLMDEPLASLDMQSKEDILPYLETLNSSLNIPIIYVSHSPDEVMRIADHMVLLEHGKVRAQGEVNEILTRLDLPLAHLGEASAVINGSVIEHDLKYHLTYVEISNHKVAVSYKDIPLGSIVRVRILARDISLALQPNHQSSITNIFPVIIKEMIETSDPSRVLVTLDMNGEQLLAKITARSVDVLALKTEQTVYAQVKSVALMK